MIKYLLILLFVPVSVVAAAQDMESVEGSSDWRGIIKLARNAYRHKEYQRAMLFYKTALEVMPGDVNIADEIAQTQFRLEQFDAAQSIYEKITSGDIQEKARAFHNLGNIAMQNKEYDKAIESYRSAIRNNPKNEKTRYNLSQAIRKKKEQEKQNPPPPSGEGDDKEDSKNKKDDNKNKDPQDSGNQKNPSSLSDNSVERELDKLMRKEAQTKRKLASSKEGNSPKTSTKEW